MVGHSLFHPIKPENSPGPVRLDVYPMAEGRGGAGQCQGRSEFEVRIISLLVVAIQQGTQPRRPPVLRQLHQMRVVDRELSASCNSLARENADGPNAAKSWMTE
eukprot:5039121-Prymnesium_polylepis.2